MKNASIYDIAKAAKVSPSTVSRVLNNFPHIKVKTREKVLVTMKKMNFRPNASARQLSHAKSTGAVRKNIYGMLIPAKWAEGFSSDFHSRILSGALKKAEELGLKVFTGLAKARYRSMVELPEFIKDGLVDGVIVVGQENDSFIEQMVALKVPTVLVNAYYNRANLDAVLIDNKRGAYAAVSHLIAHGHRRIGVLWGNRHFQDAQERFDGYREALDDHGIAYDERLSVDGFYTYEGGYIGMQELLSRAERPTAVFAMCDKTALGAKAAAEDAGLSVPRDLSIVGFDDIGPAAQVRPGLTTVHVPCEEMGGIAVLKLRDIVAGVSAHSTKVVVSVELIERGTVANATV